MGMVVLVYHLLLLHHGHGRAAIHQETVKVAIVGGLVLVVEPLHLLDKINLYITVYKNT